MLYEVITVPSMMRIKVCSIDLGLYNTPKGFTSVLKRCRITSYNVCYTKLLRKSIEQTLLRIIDGTLYSSSDLVLHNDLWLSFDHHGSFSNADAQQCVLAINHSLALAHNFLRNTDYLFITFGTSWVYQLAENSVPVANCHIV